MKRKECIKGANPYMPLWEHVPDGEPRVFEYCGEKRVYVYGSHDTMRTEYCGKDYVVWSAPVDDLTDWSCHGTCYESCDGSVLYAPDVVQKGDTFYLYSAEQKGSCVYVSESKSPAGPFSNPRKTDLGFDPGILVDDDGRVYAYWGFCACWCCELNEDMATIKEGTLHAHPMKHTISLWAEENSAVESCADAQGDVAPSASEGGAGQKTDGNTGAEDAFFEASSPRKVFGKYVYIYSKRYFTPVPELGVYTENNGFLSYKYSDSPLEGFLPGGDISFNGGEILKNPDGTGTMSYRWGNNHGSIMEINGKWYVFYHRQTGTDEYSRQAMLEPIDVAMDHNGKIFIGDITYEEGEPVSSKPVEMTSQGAQINGLDAYKLISAGYACHLTDRRQLQKGSAAANAYIRPVYEQEDTVSAPIADITDGVTAGYRYLQFGPNTPKRVTAFILAKADLTVNVRIDDYRGKICAVLHMKAGESQATAEVTAGMVGKHAVYFEFLSEKKGVIAEFDRFTFD